MSQAGSHQSVSKSVKGLPERKQIYIYHRRRIYQLNLNRTVLLLLSYSIQLQHDEDSDTFSACWVILFDSIVHRTLTWTTGSLTCLIHVIFLHVYTHGEVRLTRVTVFL